MDAVIPALIISVILMIVGSLVSETTEGEREFFRDMNDIDVATQVIENHTENELVTKYNRTRRIAHGLIALSVLIFGGLFAVVGLPLL
jgi:hypothetical protein